jgi:hypothetical protein
MNPRKAYYVQRAGSRRDGSSFFDMVVDGRKHRLGATTREAADAEAKARYERLAAERAPAPTSRHVPAGTLRAGFAAYFASDTFALYKPLTQRQQRSHAELVMRTPTPSGSRELGDTKLGDWLTGREAPDSVQRVMSLCGSKAAAANHRLKVLNNFFRWLLSKSEPQAGGARLAFNVSAHATNPCRDVEKAKPKRGKDGKRRTGHTPFETVQVEDWLDDCKDDAEQHRAVRLMQITGARTSDLHRLNRGMIKTLPGVGRVLTYTCEKGKGSAFRNADSVAVVPMVPELEALVAELPKDRFVFIHSENDQPHRCAEGLGNRIREWRRDAGLPEGLSAHGMRKAATHWWLRNHRDLIANNFSLKTIFGWVTDKELERYTADFDREEEARGMLVRLADRRKRA